MSAVKSRDTKPEWTVRHLVHAMGYRYRLHRKDLPGTPDLVFPSRKKIIFVNGCYWHRHPSAACKLARLPKSRKDFWIPKLEQNRRRDLTNQRRLRRMGWSVMVVWECSLSDLDAVEDKIRRFLA